MSAAVGQRRAVIPNWHPANAANLRRHWSQRFREDRRAKELAYWHAKEAGWLPIEGRARLHIVLSFPRGPLPDADNLMARVKPLVDGVKCFFVDDGPKWLDLSVESRRGPKETSMELEEAS